MSMLEVKNLKKQYPAFLLDGVSFTLEEGVIAGFIGRNGAGKTTTLKSLLGFVHPDEGEILFFGKKFKDNEYEIKQDIGYVSGGFSFYPNKKLKTISAVTAGFYEHWDEKLYRFYCEKFQLDENKTPSQLSEGMKVKYSMVLALSHHAKFLLLDEPTSGLDPISRDELLDIFLELQEKGTTILFSTHITSDLDKCADQIIYIQKGKIAENCTMEAFTEKYAAVELSKEQYETSSKELLIGCKKSKHGFSAIVRKEDAAAFAGSTKEADLETVMIHLEKEAGYDEVIK